MQEATMHAATQLSTKRMRDGNPCYIHALPSDLLRLIFVYFTPYVRLRVLQRICRCWRLAVRQSITSPPTEDVVDALTRYPALEIITINKPLPADMAFPRTLREVSIVGNGKFQDCYCQSLLRSPIHLTALEAPIDGQCACAARLLTVHASSLRSLGLSLSLPPANQTIADTAATLKGVDLPMLESFALRLVFPCCELLAALRILFLQLLPQLSNLRLEIGEAVSESYFFFVPEGIAGKLETAELRLPHLSVASLRGFLSGAPNLASLKLKIRWNANEELSAILHLVPHVLVCFDLETRRVCVTDDELPVLEPLSQCSKLLHLTMHTSIADFPDNVWLPHASRLRTLDFLDDYAEARSARVCTALSRLSLEYLEPLKRMPNLTDLQISGKEWPETIAYLENALKCCPSLRSITIFGPSLLSTNERPLLVRMLAEAEARGLERFIVRYFNEGECVDAIAALRANLLSLRIELAKVPRYLD